MIRADTVDPSIDLGHIDQSSGRDVGVGLGEPSRLPGDTALPRGFRNQGGIHEGVDYVHALHLTSPRRARSTSNRRSLGP